MKFGDELAERVNGEKWRSIMPETDVDKCVMTRIYMDAVRGIAEFDDYYLGFSKYGVDSDGSLGFGIAAKDADRESFMIYDGSMVMLVHDHDYIVRIAFDPNAEEILPEGIANGIVCGYMGNDCEEYPDFDVLVEYQQRIEMNEYEHPDEED
jgi:hypothetical protein